MSQFKKSIVLSFLWAFTLTLNASPIERSIDFLYGDLKMAKYQAGIEGKIYIVEFFANWCAPCKMMDQTTFKDPSVVSFINENIIAVKINIDDFDGYAWKQQYDVETLPTILVFNSKGKLLDRMEEAVTSTKLLDRLKKHNITKNRSYSKAAYNRAPSDELKSNNHVPDYKQKTFTGYQFEDRTYRLEMGAFTAYEDALELYQELNTQFIDPIIVLHEIEYGKTVFRLLMGEFQTEDEAISFRNILKQDFNYNSFVY